MKIGILVQEALIYIIGYEEYLTNLDTNKNTSVRLAYNKKFVREKR